MNAHLETIRAALQGYLGSTITAEDGVRASADAFWYIRRGDVPSALATALAVTGAKEYGTVFFPELRGISEFRGTENIPPSVVSWIINIARHYAGDIPALNNAADIGGVLALITAWAAVGGQIKGLGEICK